MESVVRFFQETKQSFFIFGARGTGKSTWLKKYYSNSLYIDLLDPELHRRFLAEPERLNEVIEAYPEKKIVIIDEIQKVPELLSIVHQLIEKDKAYLFILTGSSARKLKRTGVDLLAGRVILKTMHPFMAAELGEIFNLQKALKIGMLPLVWDSINSEQTLKAYISLYLQEEVMIEGIVRNVGNFSRFLEAMSFSHGNVLNTSEVARECKVSRKTVEAYIEILEDLLLGFRINVFSKRAKRHLQNHPKFYFFDTGVFLSLRPEGFLDQKEDSVKGQALEGLVFQHLKAWNAYGDERCQIFFWRTKSKVEIDFVVYGPEIFAAIEVKNSSHIRLQDLKGLQAFHQDYPEAKLIFVYRGKDRLKRNNILCIPCEEFLKGMEPGKTL